MNSTPNQNPRSAGVLLHITSLPGAYGIGEIGGAARDFVDDLVSMGLSTWQFLPLGPTGFGDSPYQPLSSFAGNELMIDTETLIQQGWIDGADADPLKALPEAYVDFAALIPTKLSLLKKAATTFLGQSTQQQQQEFETFSRRHNDVWLHDYALFRVLKDRHEGRTWSEWSSGFVTKSPDDIAAVEMEQADNIAVWKVLQFFFYQQWAALRQYANDRGVTLFGDLPFYIALDSADAWSAPELLRLDDMGRPLAVAGVPPDYFSADGQLWGNPLYDWEAHAKQDYAWWCDRFRAAFGFADLVRLDHFRGLESFWAVPAVAKTAREGEWVMAPGDEVLTAVAKDFGNLPIVAEDLGVITDEVEALRDRHNLPGMVVLQFKVEEPDFALGSIPENAVCYTGTHDNDTSLGWYTGESEVDFRSAEEVAATQHAVRELLASDGSEVAWSMIRAILGSKARLSIAPLQDYFGLGSEARFNTPGLSGGNWQWRFTRPQLSHQLKTQIAQAVVATGRQPAGASE